VYAQPFYVLHLTQFCVTRKKGVCAKRYANIETSPSGKNISTYIVEHCIRWYRLEPTYPLTEWVYSTTANENTRNFAQGNELSRKVESSYA